jgi:glycosyltransferase involved in cell wall biosynthesis
MTLVPAISIVVPCYNHGKYLREAVQSSFGSAHAVEVVVVNDGSTDSTAEVMERLEASAGAEIRRVSQPNGGVAAARNRGLSESRGQYVVFLDADDRLMPSGLDIGAAALDAHPESAYVFGRSRLMATDGALPALSEPRITANHYRELLRRNCIGVTATVMFRREALERAGGFNPAVTATADYELYLHIARHHPVHDHAELVAEHRTHDGAMDVDVSRMLRETLLVLRGQRPFLEADDASLDAYEEGRRRWQEFYGAQLLDEMRAAAAGGEWMRAAGRAVALARYDPRGVARHAAQSLKVGRRLSTAK